MFYFLFEVLHLLSVGSGLLLITESFVCDRSVTERNLVFRIQANRSCAVRYRLCITLLSQIDQSAIGVRIRVLRIDLDQLIEVSQGSLVVVDIDQKIAASVQHIR